MKEKVAILIALLALIVSIGGVQAGVPGTPENITCESFIGRVEFSWDVNATAPNATTGYNATVYGSGVWVNSTNTYYHVGGGCAEVINVYVWASNSTGYGNLSNFSASKTCIVNCASRGAPALTPIGIVAAIGIWSMLLLVYKRRKR